MKVKPEPSAGWRSTERINSDGDFHHSVYRGYRRNLFDDVALMWDDDQFVAADYETTGIKPEYALQPWRIIQGKAWVTSFAWVYREAGQTLTGGCIKPDPLVTAEFLHWCIQNNKVIVCWNATFDIAVMIALGFRDLVYQCRFIDGMLVWRHLDIEPEYDESGRTKKSYSLKKAVPEFLPAYAGYEADIEYHTDDPIKLRELHEYNIQDNFFTLKITKRNYLKLKPKQRAAMWMESRCLPMVAEANVRGLLIDTIASKMLSARLASTAAKKLASLAPHGMTSEIIASPKQLATLMFDQWKLPIFKTTTTLKGLENRSTDKEVLFELALLDKRAKEVREYREALGNKTKFADRLQESVEYNEDWCVHPQARVYGSYTGRMTISSKQNTEKIVSKVTKTKGIVERKRKIELPIGWAQHQMKRDKIFREQVITPPGYDMVEFDAAGQEYKWMAVKSGDPVMLRLCMPGEDPHSYMTAEIYRENYIALKALVKAEDKGAITRRKLGKIGNLGLQYRTSAKRLRVTARVDYDVLMTQPEADLIWVTYQRTYTHMPHYWRNQIAHVRAVGYAETFAGRRVKVQGDWNGRLGWSMESTAINFPIQGTGADQKYLAMSLLRDKLLEFDGYFAFDLHDGLYSFLPKNKSKAFIADVKPLLDDLPYGPTWGFIPPVPMTFDAKIGPNWGALHNFQP